MQYLGVTRDPKSKLPVLLMELLDESLTKMLECSQQSLTYHVQVDICHDVALAVAYLHSNDIIHRDLSSNNVLIMAKSRAKVTDFGMSKLAGAAPRMTPLTMCPGTLAYMPPEALDEPPIYTKKLDCFSEGVIMIQMCTRLWPEPGPRTKTVQDSRSPTGRMQMPVLEPERRKNHIDMIDRGHGLLPIAMDCLHYQENERPSSEELCQRLARLKETREYRECVEQVERVQNDIAELERQIGEMQAREEATVQQLRDENQQLWDENQQHQSTIQSKNRLIRKLTQQLDEREQVTAEILDQQTKHSLQRQVEQLQSQQAQPNTKPSQLTSPAPLEVQVKDRQLQQEQKQSQPSLPKPHPPMRRMILGEWRHVRRAPHYVARGAAVVDRNVAYFVGWSGQTCSYNLSTKKWSELPECPYESSSLAVVRGLLTAIGGHRKGATDSKLLSIVNDEDKKWVEHFPPMPTKRSHTAAVTTEKHLIVAGGESGLSNRLDTVEVMDIHTLVWSTAASLPHPYSRASATICGDHIYMLGGFVIGGLISKSVVTCLLSKFLETCNKTDSVWNKIPNVPRSLCTWRTIADVPVYHSTCAAVNGELVAVGGRRYAERKIIDSIHKYNPTTDSWDIISNMPTARDNCLVAVLPTNEMMVVGGYANISIRTNKVEIASIHCT